MQLEIEDIKGLERGKTYWVTVHGIVGKEQWVEIQTFFDACHDDYGIDFIISRASITISGDPPQDVSKIIHCSRCEGMGVLREYAAPEGDSMVPSFKNLACDKCGGSGHVILKDDPRGC